MSSVESNIYNTSFNSYNDALSKLLEYRGLPQKWLVKNIIEEGQKFSSLQSMASRWLSKGEPISEAYQEKINDSLDVSIEQGSDGKWRISRTTRAGSNQNQDAVLEEQVNYLTHLLDSDRVQEPSQADAIRALEVAESLIRSAKELLKRKLADD